MRRAKTQLRLMQTTTFSPLSLFSIFAHCLCTALGICYLAGFHSHNCRNKKGNSCWLGVPEGLLNAWEFLRLPGIPWESLKVPGSSLLNLCTLPLHCSWYLPFGRVSLSQLLKCCTITSSNTSHLEGFFRLFMNGLCQRW